MQDELGSAKSLDVHPKVCEEQNSRYDDEEHDLAMTRIWALGIRGSRAADRGSRRQVCGN